MRLLLAETILFLNAVGFPPYLPHGTSRPPGQYATLEESIVAVDAESGIFSIDETFQRLSSDSALHTKKKRPPPSAESDALSPEEVLLKYRLDIDLHYKRKDFKPSRSMGRDFTILRQQETHNQAKAVPKPTPPPAAATKGRSGGGSLKAAAAAICALIFIPPPPSGGKSSYMYGRSTCMDSDSMGEYKPR